MSHEGVQALIVKASPVMVQLTPAGWATVDGLLEPLIQGTVDGNGAFENVLAGIDPATIPGARFCVGFGEDGGTLLAGGAIAEVLVVEPAAPVPSPVPCAAEGVYLDGPRESALGSTVPFKATVLGDAPTGTVRFTNAFTPVSAPVPLTSAGANAARATFTFPALGLGRHAIGAAYAGDASNPASANALPQLHVVTRPPIEQSFVDVVLKGPPSTVEGGDSFFVATVIGRQPTGTVLFRDIGTPIGPPAPIINGEATLRTSTLAPGLHQLNALYSGDANNTQRVSADLIHTVVTTPGPEVTLTASTIAPLVGTPVTLTATIAGSPLAGAVQFLDRGVAFSAPMPLSNGRATLTTATLASGRHLITAVYERDAFNRTASAALTIDVPLAVDSAHPGDADGDAIPNAIEETVGRNPFAMDNDYAGDARLFAMQQYRDFLGREGEPGGVTFWSQAVADGLLTRPTVVEAFFRSPEFGQTVAPIVRLYFAYFLRIPDHAGLTYWIDQYRGGRSLDSISDFFASSAEFNARYGSLDTRTFVQLVYNNVLGRQPDSQGYNFWIEQLDNRTFSRGRMMAFFAESPEYQRASDSRVYVTMMYVGMLRRSPDPDGFAFWVNQLNSGQTGVGLIGGFLGSPEYRGRFLP
jgi:hypothetical protein